MNEIALAAILGFAISQFVVTMRIWYSLSIQHKEIEKMLTYLTDRLTENHNDGECNTCAHDLDAWDSVSCDGCTKGHSNYELIADEEIKAMMDALNDNERGEVKA